MCHASWQISLRYTNKYCTCYVESGNVIISIHQGKGICLFLFFPKPRLFSSALIWIFILLQYFGTNNTMDGKLLHLSLPKPDSTPVIGIGFFCTDDFILFYLYF